jgi:3-oxoacyl-[acyl-carrier-protein] synthase III
MKAYIKGISYYLPEKILTNEQINAEFPDLQ